MIEAVIGEFVSSSGGLGFLLLSATSQLDTRWRCRAFALSMLGVVAYLLVEFVEILAKPWLPPVTQKH